MFITQIIFPVIISIPASMLSGQTEQSVTLNIKNDGTQKIVVTETYQEKTRKILDGYVLKGGFKVHPGAKVTILQKNVSVSPAFKHKPVVFKVPTDKNRANIHINKNTTDKTNPYGKIVYRFTQVNPPAA